MEELHLVYLKLCEQNHTEPDECVLKKLPRRGNMEKCRLVLDLSSQNLSSKTCALLGKALSTDQSIHEVKLDDSMLCEDAIKSLVHGLSTNLFCKKLDLKGNNIRGIGAEALGRMLMQNKALKSLCLEWNALGMLDVSFSAFCEGLRGSTALRTLDLRNNQISHTGAKELAESLKRNTTLRSLDLRWNKVGLLGGRALLEMLQSNRTLIRLELAGNDVPNDTEKSIESAVLHNQDLQLMEHNCKDKTWTLCQQVRNLEREKAAQMSNMMDAIDLKEEMLRKSKRTSSKTMAQLQDILKEKTTAFNSLFSRLSLKESELSLAQQKIADSETFILQLKQELSELNLSSKSDLQREREERKNIETKLWKELSESNDKNVQLESKTDDLERKCKQQQEQIFDFKEQITHLQSEVKLKGVHFSDQLQQEKHQHRAALRDMEDAKDKEVRRAKENLDLLEKAMNDRVAMMDEHRIQLEEEISRLKSSNMADKLQAEENLILVRQKITSSEEHRSKQIEEKMHFLQNTKDELKHQANQQASLVSGLQSKNTYLAIELETVKRHVEELNQELAGKSSEKLEEMGKLKIKANQLRAELEQAQELHVKLREKLKQADCQLTEQTFQHREELDKKDKEMAGVLEKLHTRELECNKIRAEECQRSQMLLHAVHKYCEKSS